MDFRGMHAACYTADFRNHEGIKLLILALLNVILLVLKFVKFMLFRVLLPF